MSSMSIAQPLLQGYTQKECYLAEMQVCNAPWFNRLFQVLQVQTAIDLSTKMIRTFNPAFSLGTRINSICLVMGFFPKACAFLNDKYGYQYNPCIQAGLWLDRQWSKITEGGRFVALAASIALIACGERVFGSIMLGWQGFGYLENKKVLPVYLSDYVRKSASALNAAMLGIAIIAGSVPHIVYLSLSIGNQLLNYVGYKYFPFHKKLPANLEHQLIKRMRAPSSQTASPSIYNFDLSNEHLQWRFIPHFFTLQSPYEKKWENPNLSFLNIFKKSTVQVWLTKTNKANAYWSVIDAKTKKLIRIQSALVDQCAKMYFFEKERIVLNVAQEDLEEQIKQVKKKELERSILIQEIASLLKKEELKAFCQSVELEGYKISEVDRLKTCLDELREAFTEFKISQQFDLDKDKSLFVRLSLLGHLQWQRKKIIQNLLEMEMPYFTADQISFFMGCFLSNQVGLKEESNVNHSYLFGLILYGISKILRYNLLEAGDVVDLISGYVENLPFKQDKEDLLLNLRAIGAIS